MATKKTNSKTQKKSASKKEEQPVVNLEETKEVNNMSVDDITNLFIQNDKQELEQLKEKNTQKPITDETKPSENKEKENVIEKIVSEVSTEAQTIQTKPEVAEKKSVETEKNKNTKSVQDSQTRKSKSNRSVYGYDHFGIIYEY